MMIPLPKLMRHWRDKEFERGLSPATQRFGIRFWAFFARAAAALPARHPHRDAGARHSRAQPRPLRHRCRSPAAGRNTATCRRRPAARSWISTRPETDARERTRSGARQRSGARSASPARSRAAKSAVAARLGSAPPNLIPARGQRDREGRIALFERWPRRFRRPSSGSRRRAEVPTAVAAHLRTHNLPDEHPHRRRPGDRRLDWDREPLLERRTGASDGRDAVSSAMPSPAWRNPAR